MSKETKELMREIKNIEDKYGLMTFRMAITFLTEIGLKSLHDESEIERWSKSIEAQTSEDKEDSAESVLSPKLQHEILSCAILLSRFTVWTLFRYIKEHVPIQN
jgi:hypothetical protein